MDSILFAVNKRCHDMDKNVARYIVLYYIKKRSHLHVTRIVCPIFQPIFCSRPNKQPTRISNEQNSLKRSEHAIVNRFEWILKRAVSLCLSNPLPFSLLILLFLAHTKLPFDSNKSIFAPGYRLLLIIITAATPWFLIIQSAFDQTNRIKQKLTVNCGQWKYSFLGVVSTKRCLFPIHLE